MMIFYFGRIAHGKEKLKDDLKAKSTSIMRSFLEEFSSNAPEKPKKQVFQLTGKTIENLYSFIEFSRNAPPAWVLL